MKIQKPKLQKLNIGGVRPYGPPGGGAQNLGAVRSGHYHLSAPAGAATPGFSPGPQKKSSKKMY